MARDPGGRDLTSHVELHSVRRAAQRAGFETVTITSQTRFLLEIWRPARLVSELFGPDRLPTAWR